MGFIGNNTLYRLSPPVVEFLLLCPLLPAFEVEVFKDDDIGVIAQGKIDDEAPPEKFLEVGYAMLRKAWGASPLQYQRKLCGLSQSELAERAGVNLRTLQQYETGAKDLNKAAVDTVRRLAKALHCRIETLLPPQAT